MTTAALVLQTQVSCPTGLLHEWAHARRVALDVVRVDRWRELPDATSGAMRMRRFRERCSAEPTSACARRRSRRLSCSTASRRARACA
jgi:hypothetical protein